MMTNVNSVVYVYPRCHYEILGNVLVTRVLVLLWKAIGCVEIRKKQQMGRQSWFHTEKLYDCNKGIKAVYGAVIGLNKYQEGDQVY